MQVIIKPPTAKKNTTTTTHLYTISQIFYLEQRGETFWGDFSGSHVTTPPPSFSGEVEG